MSGSVLLPGCRERAWSPGDGYERHGRLWLPPNTIETPEPPPARPIGIGLFAGAGGMDLGFTNAGFHVAAASDGWTLAACTYLVNLGGPDTVVHLVGELPEGRKRERAWHAAHTGQAVPVAELLEVCGTGGAAGSGWISAKADYDAQPCEHYYLGDVRELTGEQILHDLALDSASVGAVFGGPPCQGFSISGKRQKDDPRNELVFEFMRVVIEIKPQAWCMENVPGMLDMVTKEGLPVIDAIALMAEEGGLGTFEAIRKSLAGTAGVGAALKTQKAKGRRMPPGTSGAGHFEKDDVEANEADPQLDLFGAPA